MLKLVKYELRKNRTALLVLLVIAAALEAYFLIIIAREHTLALIGEHHTPERSLIVSSHLVDELEAMIDDAVFMQNGVVALAGSAARIREQYGVGIVEMYRRIYGEGGVEGHA